MFGLENAQSLLGIVVTKAICWGLSEKRAAFPWRLAIGALAVQAGLVLLLFGLPSARAVLSGAGTVVDGLTASTQAGAAFVFGFLAGGGAMAACLRRSAARRSLRVRQHRLGRINVAGYSILAPSRQKEVMGMVWKAMLAGFLATCMTASVVGALPSGLFSQ